MVSLCYRGHPIKYCSSEEDHSVLAPVRKPFALHLVAHGAGGTISIKAF